MEKFFASKESYGQDVIEIKEGGLSEMFDVCFKYKM